jgi:GTPase SAR1 family protein
MSIKCIVIGDSLAGKTDLIKKYEHCKFPVVIDGNAMKLEMIDESGN